MKHEENIHGDVKLEDLDCATTTKLEINGGELYNTYSNKISKINNHIVDAYVKADTYCYECDSQFCNHSTLQDHRRLLHNSSNENPWNNDQEYDFDNKEFDYNYPELYAHGDDSNYICKQCEKFCVSKKDLSFHYSSEHQELKMFHCNICAKSFGTSIRLIYHIKRHKYLIDTNANEKKYKCEFCGKSFFREQQVKNHIHIVHEGRKDFKCESCGKSFAIGYFLKKHIRIIHEGHKDYKCEVCGESFSTLDRLKRHKRKIHEPPKEFICKSCSKTFVGSKALRSHMIRVKECSTNNICDTCGRNFKTESSLNQHIGRVHKTDKVKEILKCEHCPDETFETKADLGKHMRRYHKEKDCVCNVCGKAYKQMAFLRYHMTR